MRQLVLTVDVEVRGDGSGSVEGLVLRPMRRLLEVARRDGKVVTWFVDALGFDRMEREDLPKRPAIEALAQLLKEAVAAGDEVGLHLHPQWRLAQPGMFGWRARGTDVLSDRDADLVGPGVAWILGACGRSPTCFRAGGLGPLPVAVLEALGSAGVLVDSSVAPGRSPWLMAPVDRPSWSFQANPSRPEAGPFVELPIAVGAVAARGHWPGRLATAWGVRRWRPRVGGPALLDAARYAATDLAAMADARPVGPVVAIAHTKTWTERATREVAAFWAGRPTLTVTTAAGR